MSTWAGCEMLRLAAVDSTNKEARRWVRRGAPHGAVVISQTQTAGRGRRGRAWVSNPGAGLWFSIVLRKSSFAHLPFAAALAAADACQAAAGVLPDIKWPNDLLIAGRKVCGILVEMEGDAAVLGIGINVSQTWDDFPADLREDATSLAMASGLSVSMEALERALLDALEMYMQNPSLPGIYQSRCITLGKRVQVFGVDTTYEGTAEALDPDGALLVRDASGALQRVLAGDVSIRPIKGANT